MKTVLIEMYIIMSMNNVRVAHMENVVHEIVKIVYSMCIIHKRHQLQENMIVCIWQIAIIVNMHLKWCMD